MNQEIEDIARQEREAQMTAQREINALVRLKWLHCDDIDQVTPPRSPAREGKQRAGRRTWRLPRLAFAFNSGK